MLRSLLPTTLAILLAGCMGGCVGVLAGAGVGYVITKEVLPNDTHTAQVALDVEQVWETTLETLQILNDLDGVLEVKDFPRVAKAKVDGAEVVVEVDAYDLERTIIRVSAERLLHNDGTTANMVLDRILSRVRER